MKTIISAIFTLALVAVVAFFTWMHVYTKNMPVQDKLAYYYATEIMGEKPSTFMIGAFIEDCKSIVG